MADKKWSEIDELKKLKGYLIKICTLVQQEDEETYYNKLINLDTLLNPINTELVNIKNVLNSITVNGERYVIISSDENWEEETDTTKLPNLSIILELLKKINKLENTVLFKEDLNDEMTETPSWLQICSEINGIVKDIDVIQKNIEFIEKNYLKKDTLVNTYNVDNSERPASAKAVYELWKIVKNIPTDPCKDCLKKDEAKKTYVSKEDFDLWVKTFNVSEIYFDETVKSGDPTLEEIGEIDHIVINIKSRAIFKSSPNGYELVNLSEEEIKTWIQEAIKTHNEDINSHIPFRGKMVGETNPLSDATDEEPFIGSSERFNDYVNNSIPNHLDDYFHSIINKNNKIMGPASKTFDVKVEYFQGNDASDTYSVIISTDDNIDLNDFVGYGLTIGNDSKVVTNSGSTKLFKDCFDVPPTETKYLIQGLTDGRFIIALNKYNENGIYDGVLNKQLGAVADTHGRTTKFIENDFPLIIKDVYIERRIFNEADSYVSNPVFIAGSNNLCAKGNQFIIGSNNIPTDSCFIIGNPQTSGIEYSYGGQGLSINFIRDNIFEIDQKGLIFIKYPHYYTNLNGEKILSFEYKCLQKILSDSTQNNNESLSNLRSQIKTLNDTISTLEEKIAYLETQIDNGG